MTVHVLAGVAALLAALVALWAPKGSELHRLAGLVYAGTMVVMAATAAALAAFIPERVFVVAGGLTLYLVATGLLTVRPPPVPDQSVHWVALGVGGSVALLSLTFAAEALAQPDRQLDGFPAWLYCLGAAVALMGIAGDLAMLRWRAPQGVARLRRHLWRMLMALVVTVAAFFLGQSQVFPQALQSPLLLGLPVLVAAAALAYWLWQAGRQGQD